jgi:hypothetical protein
VCLRGEVAEGSVRLHDLVRADGVYFILIPESTCVE